MCSFYAHAYVYVFHDFTFCLSVLFSLFCKHVRLSCVFLNKLTYLLTYYFIKIQIGLTFLVPAYSGCTGKEAAKRVCSAFPLSRAQTRMVRWICGVTVTDRFTCNQLTETRKRRCNYSGTKKQVEMGRTFFEKVRE